MYWLCFVYCYLLIAVLTLCDTIHILVLPVKLKDLQSHITRGLSVVIISFSVSGSFFRLECHSNCNIKLFL